MQRGSDGAWVGIFQEDKMPTRFRGWPAAVEEYLSMLAVSRSSSTVRNRRNYIQAYVRWHTQAFGRPPCRQCPDAHIIAYLSALKERVSPNTVHLHYYGLRHFGRWAQARGYISTDPLGMIPPPKLTRHMVSPLSDADLTALLSKADEWDKAFILLGLGSGLRLGEIAALKWSDIKDGVAVVTGKGNKQRLARLARVAVAHLETLPRLSERVFPVGYSALEKRMTRLGERCGIEKMHPHLLRHSFAVRFLRSWHGNFEDLRILLGHTSYTMTAHYVRSTEEERAIEAAARYNPADALLSGPLRPAGGKVIPFRRRPRG